MVLYPSISDESLLLDNECKKLLKRRSRQMLIQDVMNKINNTQKLDDYEIKNNIQECDIKNNIQECDIKKYSLFEIFILIITCTPFNI